MEHAWRLIIKKITVWEYSPYLTLALSPLTQAMVKQLLPRFLILWSLGCPIIPRPGIQLNNVGLLECTVEFCGYCLCRLDGNVQVDSDFFTHLIKNPAYGRQRISLLMRIVAQIPKLNGVAPFISDPPPTRLTTFSIFFYLYFFSDTWHMAFDTWHVTSG